MDEMKKFKQVVLTWVYNQLNAEFPEYFNAHSYVNLDGCKVDNHPNVYWADTVRDRPLDATECCLDIIQDDSITFGTDGEFYIDKQTGKSYYKLTEPHEITVNFAITSMKNTRLKLNALQAQNLTYNACSYLRMLLKSGSASDYFCYENEILTPILVCSQNKNVSEITDTSIFEDTKNRHTNQFSCVFEYTQISRREVDMAQKMSIGVNKVESIEIDLNNKKID